MCVTKKQFRVALSFGEYRWQPVFWRRRPLRSSGAGWAIRRWRWGWLRRRPDRSLAVWYSADGSRLYARTRAGRVFETNDFESWTVVQGVSEPAGGPADLPAPAVDRLPESGARLAVSPVAPGRVYALGNQLYRSDDGGRSWSNLTAFHSQSIIGPGQRSVAVSPSDPDQLAVANDFGVWRSMDGGLSWSGLNQYLPNLTGQPHSGHPRGMHGTRILVRDLGAMELAPGAEAWRPAWSGKSMRKMKALRSASAAVGTEVTALATSGQTVYAGARRRPHLGFARWRPYLDLLAAARGKRADRANFCRSQRTARGPGGGGRHRARTFCAPLTAADSGTT